MVISIQKSQQRVNTTHLLLLILTDSSESMSRISLVIDSEASKESQHYTPLAIDTHWYKWEHVPYISCYRFRILSRESTLPTSCYWYSLIQVIACPVYLLLSIQKSQQRVNTAHLLLLILTDTRDSMSRISLVIDSEASAESQHYTPLAIDTHWYKI